MPKSYQFQVASLLSRKDALNGIHLQHQASTDNALITLKERDQFRTKMTVSVISDLLKSMGGIFLGFSLEISTNTSNISALKINT